jgi:hypothetical protein
MIGRLLRKIAIHNSDKFLMINSVHDSVVLDVKLNCLTFVQNVVKMELESVNVMMKEVFNIDFNLNVPVDIKLGNSWGETE